MSRTPNATEQERQHLQELVDARPATSHLTARRSRGALVLRDERGEQPRPALRFRRTGQASWITDMASAFGQWTESRLQGPLPELLDSICSDFPHFLHPDEDGPVEGERSLDPADERRLVRSGRNAALLCAAVWLVIIALCWTMPWGYVEVGLAIVFGWVWGIATLVQTDGHMGHVTQYGGLGEWLGPLLFLFVPLFTPVGFILTLARAIRILRGTVDGGVVSGGGNSRYFKKESIGPLGRGTALTMNVLALAHPACLAVFVFRLDFLVLIELVPG